MTYSGFFASALTQLNQRFKPSSKRDCIPFPAAVTAVWSRPLGIARYSQRWFKIGGSNSLLAAAFLETRAQRYGSFPDWLHWADLMRSCFALIAYAAPLAAEAAFSYDWRHAAWSFAWRYTSAI